MREDDVRELGRFAPDGEDGDCARLLAMLADGDLVDGARRTLLRGIVDSFKAQGMLGRYLEVEPVSRLGKALQSMVSDTASEMARRRPGGSA